MAVVNFKGFDDFSRRSPRLMRKYAKLGGTELSNITLDFLARKAIDLTPIGPGEEAQRRVAKKGSPAYGHMRDRWFKVVGSEGGQSGTKRPARSKVTLKPGQGAKLVNDAAHALVIDRGRKRLATGRMGGTTQARTGIRRPLMTWAQSKKRSFLKLAIKKAEAKAGTLR